MQCLEGQHLFETPCLLRANIFQKKTKLGEGERVEGMKFLGIYLISGFEQPFALFNGIHSKWCKLDFDTNDAQQIGHFHCDSNRHV